MSLEIVLYDSSPVIQKIFSHILYPYAPNIYRTDQAEELINKIEYSQPDMIFMDDPAASLSLNTDVLSNIDTKTKAQNIPVILMTHQNTSPEKTHISMAKEVLKKPIQADKLTSLINRFAPKTKENILGRHLDFPPAPIEESPPAEKTAEPSLTAPKPEPAEKAPAPLQEEQTPLINVKPAVEAEAKPTIGADPLEEDKLQVVLNRSEPNSDMEQTIVQKNPSPDKEATVSLFQNPESTAIIKPPSQSPSVEAEKIKIHPAKEKPVLETLPVSQENIERIIKTEVQNLTAAILEKSLKESIQESVRETVPKLARQIIEEEISRILKDDDNEGS